MEKIIAYVTKIFHIFVCWPLSLNKLSQNIKVNQLYNYFFSTIQNLVDF